MSMKRQLIVVEASLNEGMLLVLCIGCSSGVLCKYYGTDKLLTHAY